MKNEHSRLFQGIIIEDIDMFIPVLTDITDVNC